jgi:hypothetical protein
MTSDRNPGGTTAQGSGPIRYHLAHAFKPAEPYIRSWMLPAAFI